MLICMMDGINGLHARHEHALLLYPSLWCIQVYWSNWLEFFPLVIVIWESANKGGVLGRPDANLVLGSGVFGLQTYKLTNLQACKGDISVLCSHDLYHFTSIFSSGHGQG